MIKNCFNTFFSSVFRVLGRFLAYAIVGFVFYLLAGYLGLLNVQARTLSFVGANNAGVTNDIYENDQILNLNGHWDYGTNIFKNNDPLWYNTGLYFYNGNLNGDILQINADFYFGVVVHYPSDSYLSYNYSDYTSTSNNPFKPENLRCGIAENYADGYDGTHMPEVTNWFFEVEEGSDNTGGINKHYRYHLKFNYKQNLSSPKYGASNISCWFNLPNTNTYQGQFFGTSSKLNSNVGFLAKTNYLLVSVNSDPNTGLLIDMVDQNNTIINQNQQTNDKLDQAEETRKGIWQTIKELPSKFLDMLKGLFIPDNFDFLDDFKNTLETKLGFIAEVPIALIDFISGLVTTNWSEFNSISFPAIEIFGVNFWGSQEVSLQEAIDIFSPYKYITDVICVVICVNTLKRWYDDFAGGGNS